MKVHMEVHGVDRALAFMEAEPRHVRRGASRGLYKFALDVMQESQAICPVGGPPTSPDDRFPGTLRNSGTVRLPEETNGVITVELGYGGAAYDYARRQHEDLTYAHKPGQQAKFLEEPLLRKQGEALGIIVDEIQLEKASGR